MQEYFKYYEGDAIANMPRSKSKRKRQAWSGKEKKEFFFVKLAFLMDDYRHITHIASYLNDTHAP